MRAQKTQNGRFQSKIALCLKKVCFTVSLCENSQQQSCKAFIGLSIRVKMIGGDVIFYVRMWRKLTYPVAKCGFSVYFCS